MEEKTCHPLPVRDQELGVRKSIRDAQPTHFTFKIQSSSLLSMTPIERYESGDFEAGGYNWKTVDHLGIDVKKFKVTLAATGLNIHGSVGPKEDAKWHFSGVGGSNFVLEEEQTFFHIASKLYLSLFVLKSKKLALYPNGKENKNGKFHISLYLVMAETSSLPPGWEVDVAFNLFLFDQIRDKYMTIEDIDGRVKRFHGMKTEWGFPQFIPLSIFNDPSKGYLVDATCVFGAEVFIIKSTGKGECLSMVEGAINGKHTWKIENFSQLQNEYYFSDVFISGDHKWKVKLYPKGNLAGKDNSLSMYLFLADDSSTVTPGQKVYTEFRLRIRNQSFYKHIEYFEAHTWFGSSSINLGWPKFIGQDDLNDPEKGFLVKDTCIVEAEVTVLAEVNKFP